MEHLTKAQIVLLTLFASFVSSMATGIVVVTLMQQAPEPILQTITRVVEKTIEKVVPTIVEKPGRQVVVKDEDLMVSAIDRNVRSVLALKIAEADGTLRSAGVGTIVSIDGLVVTDTNNTGGGVITTTIGGVRYTLELISFDTGSLLSLGRLVPLVSTSASASPIVFPAAVLGNSDTLKVGQTAVVIGGRDGKTISNGLITNLDERIVVDKDTKVETKILEGIGLSQVFTSTSNGSPIITLEGVVVGFVRVGANSELQVGVPVAVAKDLLKQLSDTAVTTGTSTTTVKTEPAKNNLSAEAQNSL